MALITPKKIWDDLTNKDGSVNYERITEGDVFKMSREDWDKLRFRISNMTLRLVECYNHPQGKVFGLRLHPPHLWDLRDGVLYKKTPEGWVKYFPNFDENLERLA